MTGNVVGRFFSWWGHELVGMLPRRPRSRTAERSAYLLFDITNQQLDVYYVARGRKQELGHGPAAAVEKQIDGESPARPASLDALAAMLAVHRPQQTPVVVEVPAEKVLNKQLELPLAAEETLHQVLSYEMERQTPFRSDAVYFDFDVLERLPSQQKLVVALRVVPRRCIDAALAVLGDWNLRPTDIIQQAASGTFLVRFISERYRGRGSPRVLVALAGINVALLAAILLVPVVKQHAYLDVLDAELERARAAALVAAQLEERVEKLDTELRTLSSRKQLRRTMVELVNEISVLLPDTTWLQRLEVKNGEAHLRGVSDTATSLIAIIEESEMFDQVRFRSPVTRDRVTGGERFYVSARVAQRHTAQNPDSDG